jgi:diadenosine tetraphosphate (Ap4A) HIT family hydrolase
MSTFTLHPRLQEDTLVIGQLPLCQLLMMNDSQYPWFILVPAQANLTEIYQLSPADQNQLITESSLLAKTLQQLYQADKLNIAAIGNLVSQLHIHHVVRYQTDISWPAPIWGKFPALAYTTEQAEQEIFRIKEALQGYLSFKVI